MKIKLIITVSLYLILMAGCKNSERLPVSSYNSPQPFAINHRAATNSSIDISFLLEKPAGKNGFITVKDGRLMKPDDSRMRLWGVNITDWTRGSVQIPAKEEASFWAQTLSHYGINCCRWFLGVDIPTKVTSAGGRYAAKDDWETPDTQIASFEFADQKVITWEGRSCQNYPIEGSSRGFIIYGNKGTLVNLGGEDYKVFDSANKLVSDIKSERKADANNTVSASGDADLYHFNNFIESIRGTEKPNASIQSAHESVLLCHLANISQRVGSSLTCDPKNGHIIGNKEAEKLWSRSYQKGWEMKL